MPKSLVDRVRDKLAAGTLPREDPVKLWLGLGTGARCAACDETLRRSDSEYELQFERRPPILLHHRCHAMWEAQRRRPD